MKIEDKLELCEELCIHEGDVFEVKKEMPKDEILYDLADLFKVFGDSTRIRILWALSVKELCVCDIATTLDATQSAISHQLRILKQAHLVKGRKVGKSVYYSLDDSHIKGIFEQGLAHVGHLRDEEQI